MKKIHACNRMNFSSNINEVNRAVLNSFFFFKKRFRTHQKHQKDQKHQKVKRHPGKSTKMQISEEVVFSP